MNFLAHIYLSGDDPDIMVGNFIADAVKGRQYEQFPQRIQMGIKLHRFIDHYTDTHPIVEQSKIRLRGEYHKYAGVIMDMYYDHFLAANWLDHHHTPLDRFSQETYKTVQSYDAILPEKIQFMLPYMMKHNWLHSYRKVSGIAQALTGLSKRTKFESKMELAGKNLEQDYLPYLEEFNSFLPALREATAQKLQSLESSYV
jgi:acyl carrier protein phosphodiesterase